jgi:rhodanese-related sulfurtransferase/glyoxylase-like metal-dependent hydrolase (beta-lactamase superfamily II)
MTRLARFALVLAVAALATHPSSARAEDAEKATHGDAAATPQITHDVETSGVRVRQYELGCLSQLTYLVVSKGEAAVVDPQRDVDHYLRDAKALGAKVTHVFLTHTNADFVAGHTELARGGATVHIAKESGSKFPHDGLVDGAKVAVGDATFEAWATPGHTLDSMCLLLHVPGATPDPLYVFTGDTLFIGGIGRPDLMGGDATPVRLASAAFDSIARLKTLPAATKVLPAHGAGSLCGAHLSPETISTIGDERRGNPYLAPMSRAQFVSRVVSGLPVAPAYFKFNAQLNREGPPVIEGAPAMPPGLAPADFKTRLAAGAWAIDLRDAKTYAAGHVEGSVNVAIRGRLDTWTGIVVPFDASLLLVGSDDEVTEAAFRFRRIGLDKVEGHLAGGIEAWKAAGLPVRTNDLWSPERLMAAMREGTEPILVDVRAPAEVEDVRIGDYANLPLSDWERFGRVLDPKAPVLFVCNSAYRSSMAVGLAERQGFTTIASLDGGVDAWLTAKLPTKGTARVAGAAVCTTPPPPSEPEATTPSSATFLLPEAMTATALAAGLLDQAKAYAVLDVRVAWQFDEYHVPGATRVEPDAIVAHVKALDPALRVVLVDRDGTAAFAVAGMLSAAVPGRSIRVLTGGTAAFWRDVEGAASVRTPGGVGGAPGAAPAAPRENPTAPTAPSTPKKRPAGC